MLRRWLFRVSNRLFSCLLAVAILYKIPQVKGDYSEFRPLLHGGMMIKEVGTITTDVSDQGRGESETSNLCALVLRTPLPELPQSLAS